MSSRQQEKQRAREMRLEAERAKSRQTRRRKQKYILGGTALLAVAVVAVAVALGSGGESSDNAAPIIGSKAPVGAGAVNRRFNGIPQNGMTVGDPKAPVTLVEFADLKCPVCREFNEQTLPTLVDRYVREGKLKIDLKLQTFVGAPGDSERAARFALAAAKQNKAWQFADLFYLNQQDESTRYVSDAFLKHIGGGVKGLNLNQALKDRDTNSISDQLNKASDEFSENGFSGTPSFLMGRTGKTLAPLSINSFDPSEFTGPIDSLLQQP